MEGKKLVFACTIFVVIAFGAFLYIQLAPKKTEIIKPIKILTPSEPTCGGSITKNCEVNVTVNECDEKVARNMLQEQLVDPFTHPSCRQAQEELAKSCPEGCFLDYSTFFNVSGKAEIYFEQDPSSEKKCAVSGRRKIRMRATCKRSEG